MIDMLKNKYLQHKETIHNFIWRSMQIFAKQGITFLIFILSAKLLTPYDFGIYNYLLAIMFFLIMFGDFGISTATSKYVADFNINYFYYNSTPFNWPFVSKRQIYLHSLFVALNLPCTNDFFI